MRLFFLFCTTSTFHRELKVITGLPFHNSSQGLSGVRTLMWPVPPHTWAFCMSKCVCARACMRACMCVCHVCACVCVCWLTASCHSWTTHGHICQCHEIEPFAARSGNLSYFPRVFSALFIPPPPLFFSVESQRKCAIPKNAITF